MFTYGFYNSKEGDRKYNAEQMSSIFDGIIEDGVYSNVGEALMVIPGTGMQVIVKTGRAWFKHTWSLNDAYLPLSIKAPDVYRNRIDAVVLEINKNLDVRANEIKVVQGTPATTAQKPTMKHEEGIDQYALAYVTVEPGVDAIVESKIEIAVGKNETPFVQCPLKTVSIEDLFNQWQGEFDEWFDNVQSQLEGDIATNLQNQIDQRVKIADKATEDDVKNANPSKWISAQMLKESGVAGISDVGTIVLSANDLEKKYPTEFMRCDGREVDAMDKIEERIPLPFATYSMSSGNSLKEDVITTDRIVVDDVVYFCYQGSLHMIQNGEVKKGEFTENSDIVAWFIMGDRIVFQQNLSSLRKLSIKSVNLNLAGSVSTFIELGDYQSYIYPLYIIDGHTLKIINAYDNTYMVSCTINTMGMTSTPYTKIEGTNNYNHFNVDLRSELLVSYVWDTTRNPKPFENVVQRDSQGRLYILLKNNSTSHALKLIRSSDNGSTWEVAAGWSNITMQNSAMPEFPTNVYYNVLSFGIVDDILFVLNGGDGNNSAYSGWNIYGLSLETFQMVSSFTTNKSVGSKYYPTMMFTYRSIVGYNNKQLFLLKQNVNGNYFSGKSNIVKIDFSDSMNLKIEEYFDKNRCYVTFTAEKAVRRVGDLIFFAKEYAQYSSPSWDITPQSVLDVEKYGMRYTINSANQVSYANILVDDTLSGIVLKTPTRWWGTYDRETKLMTIQSPESPDILLIDLKKRRAPVIPYGYIKLPDSSSEDTES